MCEFIEIVFVYQIVSEVDMNFSKFDDSLLLFQTKLLLIFGIGFGASLME